MKLGGEETFIILECLLINPYKSLFSLGNNSKAAIIRVGFQEMIQMSR